MSGIDAPSLALSFLAAAMISLGILWLLGRSWHRATGFDADPANPTARTTSFVFDRNDLVDQDENTEHLPGIASGDIDTWTDLRDWLGNRFGVLPSCLSHIEEGETRDFPALDRSDMATLALSRRRSVTRVEVLEPAMPGPVEQHRTRSLDRAFARNLQVLDNAPCAIRISNATGQVLWQNERFAACSKDDADALVEAAKSDTSSKRISISGEHAGQNRHYEVDHILMGEDDVVYATDVTQIAQAEMMRREFIQTLTKIFANLTTGLAVFDRHRRLALFNPALYDLTDLPASFLLSQPPLMQFFDQLRDNKVLPEPKNYDTWRTQIEDMISTASDGLYVEDWALPNGMTYRVTGRPHPDGAIAFLFEDITDNVSIARHYRGQITLRDAVLDATDEARAVFGPGNVLTLSNRACRDLLGIDPDASFADIGLEDFLRVCQDTFNSNDGLDAIKTAVIGRSLLSDHVIPSQPQPVIASVQPLPGNSALVSFAKQPALAPEAQTTDA